MLIRTAAVLMAGALFTTAPVTASPAPRDRLLVTAAWLQAHLKDPNLVLLQVGPRQEYEAGHIPGARYLSFDMISTRADTGLSLELPPVATLDSAFAALGITRNSRIVLYYTSQWVSPTTRAWLTLEYLGLGQATSILDGGLPAWTAAGGSVSRETPDPVSATRFGAIARPGIVVDANHIRTRQGTPKFRLVDARDTEFYRGLATGSGTRPGHLPGAKSLPFTSVTDDEGRFLPDSALRRLFKEAGVTAGDEVVAYCHIGQQATAVVFAGRLLGYDIRLYDGSFQDWSRHETNIVEGGIPVSHGGLISTDALADRIAQGDITVIDLRSDLNAYLANHIPGAVYLHYETLRASANGVPGDILPAANYAVLWSRLGIRRDRAVAIYASGDQQNFNATFLAGLLTGFHHPEVYVVDGGMTKWAAENRAQSREYPRVDPVPYPETSLFDVVTGEHVQHMVGQRGVVLVDVRPADQFAGTAGAQARRGHIPGAVNHFWQSDLTGAGAARTWKSVEELRAAYAAQGITPDKYIIVYCNTGTEASHAWFALHYLLGYPDVAVYVPSWTEWAGRADLPIESGAQASATTSTPTDAKGCSDH